LFSRFEISLAFVNKFTEGGKKDNAKVAIKEGGEEKVEEAFSVFLTECKYTQTNQVGTVPKVNKTSPLKVGTGVVQPISIMPVLFVCRCCICTNKCVFIV